MSANFARPLNGNDLAHRFLVNVLQLPNNVNTGTTAIKIRESETLLRDMEGKSTLSAKDNRHPQYIDNTVRRELRQRILDELVKKKRLHNDDKIKLGSGGARPITDIQKNKQAFIVTGLPASGKSSVSSKISDDYGAFIIDPDYAKRKFPEYNEFTFGASLVHEESSLIVNGSDDTEFNDELDLLGICVDNSANIVIPKIGYHVDSLRKYRDNLIKSGYSVHLTLVSLDRVKATTRALSRFIKTNRYVPLSLVFDGYGNDPTLAYYRTRTDPEWTSTGKISTDVTVGESPRMIEATTGNPANLFA